MRRSSGLPKISRDGLNIFEGCAGSAGAEPAGGAEPAAGAELAAGGAEPAADAGSGETVTRGVGNASVRAAKHSFEISGGRSGRDRGRILIISPISSSKSLRINPPNNIISSSGIFIIIIIFFKNFLNSFRSK